MRNELNYVIPKLRDRTLYIDADFPGFFYRYQVCTPRRLIGKECRMVVETYDLQDDDLRLKLKDMGFVLKRR